jgi:hypothetical protein
MTAMHPHLGVTLALMAETERDRARDAHRARLRSPRSPRTPRLRAIRWRRAAARALPAAGC